MEPIDELLEAFIDMPDNVDEVTVTTSAPVPQKDIDDFVSSYMEHNPEGHEEFILTITPLGNNQYKISCSYVGK